MLKVLRMICCNSMGSEYDCGTAGSVSLRLSCSCGVGFPPFLDRVGLPLLLFLPGGGMTRYCFGNVIECNPGKANVKMIDKIWTLICQDVHRQDDPGLLEHAENWTRSSLSAPWGRKLK